jgi:hypothetical protein
VNAKQTSGAIQSDAIMLRILVDGWVVLICCWRRFWLNAAQ